MTNNWHTHTHMLRRVDLQLEKGQEMIVAIKAEVTMPDNMVDKNAKVEEATTIHELIEADLH